MPRSVPSTVPRVDLVRLLVPTAQSTNPSFSMKNDARCLIFPAHLNTDAVRTTGLESRDSTRATHPRRDTTRWIDHLQFTKFHMKSLTLLHSTLPPQRTRPTHFNRAAPLHRAPRAHLLLLKLLCRTLSSPSVPVRTTAVSFPNARRCCVASITFHILRHLWRIVRDVQLLFGGSTTQPIP